MGDDTKLIDAGKRVKAFLEDEAVKDALVTLEKRYYSDFKEAKTPAERESLHARVCALSDLFTELLGTVNSAKLTQHQRDVRIAAEERTQKRTPR